MSARRMVTVTIPENKLAGALAYFGNFSHLCSAIHSMRDVKLALQDAGYNYAHTEPIPVPTPVRSVNAPAARIECIATGKRNRFLFSAGNQLSQSYTMKATATIAKPATEAAAGIEIRRIVGTLFADTVSITIAAIGAVVAFMAAVAFDNAQVASIAAAVSLPWMLRSLYIGQKGGAL